ncbi:hypothetical protein D3C85_1272290 [compost metagenome]
MGRHPSEKRNGFTFRHAAYHQRRIPVLFNQTIDIHKVSVVSLCEPLLSIHPVNQWRGNQRDLPVSGIFIAGHKII